MPLSAEKLNGLQWLRSFITLGSRSIGDRGPRMTGVRDVRRVRL